MFFVLKSRQLSGNFCPAVQAKEKFTLHQDVLAYAIKILNMNISTDHRTALNQHLLQMGKGLEFWPNYAFSQQFSCDDQLNSNYQYIFLPKMVL